MSEKIWSRRGFIYTIDATLALFLMVLTLAVVVFLSAQADEDPIGRVQIVRLGKDALAVMDDTGVLGTFDPLAIGLAFNSSLPKSLGAHLQVSTYYYDNGAFNLIAVQDFGGTVPGDTTTYGMRRDFVSMRNRQITNYSVARMTLWQK
jgi:hypothetical protein